MPINSNDDTIAAPATAVGGAGISIIRISGKDALEVADKIFLSKDGRRPSEFKTYTVHYGWVVDSGDKVDEVILTVMRAPRSYTMEDVVEINCHGGILASRRVLELVLAGPCRLAEPGEFTRRAFLNGRIDLAQAEAVLDIVSAKTDSALKISTRQLQGVLSAGINRIRKGLVDTLTILEVNIDFPEDEPGEPALGKVSAGLSAADIALKEILGSAGCGRILREGIHAVICGRPNVGKSSLLNALLKEERSIVTSVAGTTRDTIEEVIDIRGIPVRIVDTAGIIEPRDLVEKKAVQRSREYIKLADLVLLVFDGSRRLNSQDAGLMRRLEGKPVIAIINKIDMKQAIDSAKVRKRFKHVIGISARKLKNIALLEQAIADAVYGAKFTAPDSVLLNNSRHIKAMQEAQIFIAQAVNSLDNKLSAEFIAQDVKDALARLDRILGRSFNEDLLDAIFDKFCIGK